MAAIIGTISTLMGIGGGTLTVPVLSMCSYPVRRAVGTASVVGLIIALPGAAGYVVNGWSKAGLPPFSLGYVNLAGNLCREGAAGLPRLRGARAEAIGKNFVF